MHTLGRRMWSGRLDQDNMTTAPSAGIGRAEVSVVCAAGLSKHYLRQRRDGGNTGDEYMVIGTGTRKVTRLPVSLARGQHSLY